MQITEVKIGELLDFIKSETFQLFSPKPITDLRATSQFYNPDARPDDVALIIAHENNEVIAFAGLLPRLSNISGMRVFSNTCWWADPQKGKGIALPLLFAALKKCESKIYLNDSTPHSQKILAKTGYFKFPEPPKGIRGTLRFYFADLLIKRIPKLKPIKFLFCFGDWCFNLLWSPMGIWNKNQYKKKLPEYEEVSRIDEATGFFIKKHSEKELVIKSAAVLNWMRDYPWVMDVSGTSLPDYSFSYRVKKYELHYFKLTQNGKIKAFVAISVKDNMARLPFFYCENDFTGKAAIFIFWYVLNEKYDSLLVFCPEIIELMNKQKLFIYKHESTRITGFTNTLFNHINAEPVLCDGDGDVVFT